LIAQHGDLFFPSAAVVLGCAPAATPDAPRAVAQADIEGANPPTSVSFFAASAPVAAAAAIVVAVATIAFAAVVVAAAAAVAVAVAVVASPAALAPFEQSEKRVTLHL
jgi:hypothetical protein